MHNAVNLSAEDTFALVDMKASDTELFPHPFTFGNLGLAMRQLESHKNWRFIWDYREVEDQLYNDVKDAFEEARGWEDEGILVAAPGNAELIGEVLGNPQVLVMKPKPLPKQSFDLSSFEDDLDNSLIDYGEVFRQACSSDYFNTAHTLGMADADPDEIDVVCSELLDGLSDAVNEFENAARPDEEGWERLLDEVNAARAARLDAFLRSVGVNSLLSELAMVCENDRVHVIPYHSYSLHNVEVKRDDTVLLRPGRVSATYWRQFAHQIAELETMLTTHASESAIERLLRSNPLFLRGLNYRKVYAQVVLPLGGGKSLRPDLIAEPIDSTWCDVIDLKLPKPRLLVGRDNRRSLASALHEVAAQLREYEAYFDDRKAAKLVEQRYGFRCYKPRLIAIVGRDPTDFTDEQVRRAMTAYPRLEIVTYDQLVRAARSMLLL